MHSGEPWFPRGLDINDAIRLAGLVCDGGSWQIYGLASGGSRALIAPLSVAAAWVKTGAVLDHQLSTFAFGDRDYHVLVATHGSLAPVAGLAPQSAEDALQFAHSIARTRSLKLGGSLAGAVYIERYSVLLPGRNDNDGLADDVVLGRYLARGVLISCFSGRRLNSLVPPWLKPELDRVIAAAKLPVPEVQESAPAAPGAAPAPARVRPKEFRLHGRPQLERFFRDHVIDIIENAERYRKLGIDFPSAVMLHGPPGCGKTFAVERLVEYLDWPEFSIDASSIASPYIHDTSRKIAGVFDQAIEQKPSIIVIDEADAFIQNRSGETANQYRVEEVAEFLRRIPEAIDNQVLVVAMTNRIELIDPAILRRGRFDHIIEVPMASMVEVRYLLDHLLAQKPCAGDLDSQSYATALAGRPLSDVRFLIREAARLTARAGKDAIDHQTIRAALAEMNDAVRAPPKKRSIGFTAPTIHEHPATTGSDDASESRQDQG